MLKNHQTTRNESRFSISSFLDCLILLALAGGVMRVVKKAEENSLYFLYLQEHTE